MPKINDYGFNPYSTPKKQAALDGLAGHLLGCIDAVAQRFGTDAIVLDMTCGPGEDEYGRPGSPLILARKVQWFVSRGHRWRMVCVDREPDHLKRVQAIMRLAYPELSVSYFTDQQAALANLSANSRGLAYFDPSRYTDLDVDLLRDMGKRFKWLDILFTRECLAAYRMEQSRVKTPERRCPPGLPIEHYLAATGKRCRYVVQFATYNWWSFGFADNWEARPANKLRWPEGKMLNVDTPEGRALCDRLMKRQEEPPWTQPPLFG